MTRKLVISSFFVSLLVWAVFSWPLPRRVFDAIPFSGHHRGQAVEHMISGDHLQLLFHFWILGDMLTGQTEPFRYVYEFNTGDDGARYHLNPGFFPFSYIYAPISWLGGRALGYNIVGFFSIWATFFFTWLLTCRYSDDWRMAALAALPAIMFPFRWHSLMGGSPSGLAAMWVPLTLLGVDIAVRENRLIGGLLAGLGIFYASMNDHHIFFFTVLAVPAWSVIALAARQDQCWRNWRWWMRIAVALAPLIPLFLAAYLVSHGDLAGKTPQPGIAAARTLEETRIFSPGWINFFSREDSRFGNQVFVGFSLLILMVTCLPLLAWLTLTRKPMFRRFLVLLLCIAALAGILALALGLNGPFEGKLFLAARKLIPPYNMVRQTAKIFCLIPTITCVGAAICFAAISTTAIRKRWIGAVIAMLLVVITTVEYRSKLATGICVLAKEQGAYARIASDAASRGAKPRAIAIVLWPGDSAPSSIYEHYSSLYRIRMVNGYSPITPPNYRKDIFQRLESINQGFLDDTQLDFLFQRGIDYILLHEDQFPENVSPFPVTFTLRNLLDNPRISLLQRSDQVWAFKILRKPETREPAGASWTTWFPARRWEVEHCQSTNVLVHADKSALNDHCVTTISKEGLVQVPTNTMVSARNLRYMLRTRGNCAATAEVLLDGKLFRRQPLFIRSEDWIWMEIPVSQWRGSRNLSLQLLNFDGTADLDHLLLTAGEWNTSPEVGATVTLSAQMFFHAGHIDMEKGSVFFEAEKRSGTMLYGPKLPLAPGKYKIEAQYLTTAPHGTDMGELILDRGIDSRVGKTKITAGSPAVLEFEQPENLPVNMVFSFSGKADLDLKDVLITRLE